MRHPRNWIYIHLVWATWDRLPLITPEIEPRIYAAIRTKCEELRCEVLALGGTNNHVHPLIHLPTSLAVATLVREVKGSTSHLTTHEINTESFFRWQGAYGAFAVEKANLPMIIAYIEKQKEHHRSGQEIESFEEIFDSI